MKSRSKMQNNLPDKNNNKSIARPDNIAIKGAHFLKNKLKKELQTKFNKKQRSDEINSTTKISHLKSHSSSSLMLSNPLTKSSFSLSDSITHKANYKKTFEPLKPSGKSIYNSKKIISLSYRERYKSLDQSLFQTRAEVQYQGKDNNRLSNMRSAQMPAKSIQNKTIVDNVNLQSRHNKFKLLFKQKKSTYKSASQRKISRIDTKINALKHKKSFLQSLLPIQKPKPIFVKPVPKKYNINDEQMRERVLKVIRQLIKTLELYYNMYEHSNIVGGHLKNVQGYNNKIKEILMMDEVRAKRLTKTEDFKGFFAVFRERGERSDFYMEEDMAVYNVLNNYNMKMQKRYGQLISNYNHFDLKKKQQQKEGLSKTKERFQKKIGKHEQINKINAFIQNRIRYDQGNREDNMQHLQKRGVILSIIERSRELILREKEHSFKESLKSKQKK